MRLVGGIPVLEAGDHATIRHGDDISRVTVRAMLDDGLRADVLFPSGGDMRVPAHLLTYTPTERGAA